MGLDLYVDPHAGVDAKMSVREGCRIAHAVKDAIRVAIPEVADMLVFFELATASSKCAPARLQTMRLGSAHYIARER